MKVIVDLCVVPIGVAVHLAPCIAACRNHWQVMQTLRLRVLSSTASSR